MVRNGTVIPPYSMALGVPATIREGVVPEAVSYTHLTLPTNREV